MKLTLKERFDEKYLPVPESGCWLWTSDVGKNGYGLLLTQTNPRKKKYAHRLSYEFFNGEIPENMFVLHKCDVRSCVNPSHLFIGTAKDNHADMVSKGRDCPPPKMYGEAHGKTTITEDQVRSIRSDSRPHKEIANDYGLHRKTISRIKLRQTWGHVK
jgi:hypothetical protein